MLKRTPSQEVAGRRNPETPNERGARYTHSGRDRWAFERATWRQFQAWHGAALAGAADVARWSLEALAIAPTEVDELVPELERVFSAAVLECRVDPLPGSLETLVALRRAGVPKALVCDTGLSPGRVVRELLARCRLLGELDALVFSDEVGVAKPDARIFERALRVFGAEPSEATYIGDLLRTGVAGARELGMRTLAEVAPSVVALRGRRLGASDSWPLPGASRETVLASKPCISRRPSRTIRTRRTSWASSWSGGFRSGLAAPSGWRRSISRRRSRQL